MTRDVGAFVEEGHQTTPFGFWISWFGFWTLRFRFCKKTTQPGSVDVTWNGMNLSCELAAAMSSAMWLHRAFDPEPRAQENLQEQKVDYMKNCLSARILEA